MLAALGNVLAWLLLHAPQAFILVAAFDTIRGQPASAIVMGVTGSAMWALLGNAFDEIRDEIHEERGAGAK